MKKILIVTLSNIGDVVLTLPVFQSMVQAFPDAKIHAVVGESSRIVFQDDPRIQNILVYDRRASWQKKIKFLSDIRKERYDLIIDLRYSLIGLLGGARKRNAYLFRPRVKHKGLKHLSALKNLGFPVSTHDSFLKIHERSSDGRESGRLVAAAVGSKSDIKKWPAAYYAKLLDRLAVESHCKILLVGDSNDSKDCQAVKRLMTAPVSDMSGRTSFEELCSLLKQASLVITNDSAPLHIADSLGTPVLALFGPTDPAKYGPRGDRGFALSRDIFCSPCERPQCRFQHECMKELGVDEVYVKAQQLLSGKTPPKKLKILMIRLDRIGDLMLSLPAIQAVRERFPDAFISVMTRPATADLAQGHAAVDEVIPYFYEKNGRHASLLGYFRFLREIIRRRFDVCFILHPSVRSHLLPFLTRIPARVGFDSALSFLLTQRIQDTRHLGLKHESEYTLDIVRAFGVQVSPKKVPGVRFFAEHLRKTEKFLGQKIVAVHPGSSCASKRWPLERYAELVRMILQRTSCMVAVVGGESERELGEVLKKENALRVDNLAGQLDLKELSAFFSRCELLVSNDSGPVHVAAGAGARTVVIFGRNKPGLNRERWQPLGEIHRTIQKNVGCVVCLADACTIDFECLNAVSVEEVYEALAKQLEEKQASASVR